MISDNVLSIIRCIHAYIHVIYVTWAGVICLICIYVSLIKLNTLFPNATASLQGLKFCAQPAYSEIRKIYVS